MLSINVCHTHTHTLSSITNFHILLDCVSTCARRHRVSMEAGSSLSLKRRYEEVDNNSPFSTPKDSDDDISSSDSADSCDSLNPPSSSAFTRKEPQQTQLRGKTVKKMKKLNKHTVNQHICLSARSLISLFVFSLSATSILRHHKPSPGGKRVRFDVVTVYYFPRRQGFTSVPSQGGSSLGMARHHSSIRHYTLGEFAREQETSHRHTLRQHLRQEKLKARKMKVGAGCVRWVNNKMTAIFFLENLMLKDDDFSQREAKSIFQSSFICVSPLKTTTVVQSAVQNE